MGFDTEITAIAGSMLTNAQGFVSDFAPILAIVTGIAFAGYALITLRRFLS